MTETDEAPICPLGFWGIRKIIERQTSQDRPGDPESGFLVRSSPAAGRSVLRALDSCVLAVSANVSDVMFAPKTTVSGSLAPTQSAPARWASSRSVSVSRLVAKLPPELALKSDRYRAMASITRRGT